MINSGKYMNYIIEKISIIRYELISKNKLNLMDNNIVLENFVCEIMNYIYGYNLTNLNRDRSNFPGLDLGDARLKLGVQVTSTSSSKKINETLEKINKNKCYERFNKIKIFILSEKQKNYTIKNTPKLIEFDPKKDILDFDELYKELLYTPIDVRLKVSEFIRSEIVDVMDSLEVDYYDLYDFKRCVKEVKVEEWGKVEDREFKVLINHFFGYLPFNVDVLVNGEDVFVSVKRDGQTVELCSSMPLDCKVMIS